VGTAHSLAFFVTMYYLRSRKSVLFLSFKEYTTPNFETFKRLFKLGIPTTVEQLVWAAGQLVLSFYAGILGVRVLAAHQVFVRIQSVLTMAFTGFGIASMSLVGKNIGAAEDSAALRAGRMAGRVALVTAIVVALLLIIFQRTWIHIFTSDPKVIDLGSKAVFILALIQLPRAVNNVFTGNLRGGADLNWLMWLTMSTVLIYEVVGAYIMAFVVGMSLGGLWLIQGFDETTRLLLNYWRFRKKKWKVQNII
jgi:putative MATE family efflux protein